MSSSETTRQGRLSTRLAAVEPSATIGLIARIAQMTSEGISVISFGQGEPDFPTPEPIKASAVKALERNETRYTPTGGTLELRRALARRFQEMTGVSYTPAQVMATCGAKEALYLAFQAICDPGDEVIVPAPYWVSYIEQVRLASATPVIIPTDESSGFKMSPQQVANYLTPQTRAIVLCSPSNPTGSVYTAEEIQGLAEVLRGSDAMVIADEIYDVICFVDYDRWLRVVPDFADRTLVINGASKTYAMTGWRMGYAAGPKDVIDAMRSIQSHSTTHPTSFCQQAVLTVLNPSPESSVEIGNRVAEMVFQFRERRDVMVRKLLEIDGVTCTVPDGAFYVFPNVSGLLNRPLGANGVVCQTSQELAAYLLEHAQIGVVFGEAFGAPGYLRLSFAMGMDDLVEGMRRFAEAVK